MVLNSKNLFDESGLKKENLRSTFFLAGRLIELGLSLASINGYMEGVH